MHCGIKRESGRYKNAERYNIRTILSGLFVALSPHELYERKVTMQELHAAIASLPNKQAKRIYAHFILGMKMCIRDSRYADCCVYSSNDEVIKEIVGDK